MKQNPNCLQSLWCFLPRSQDAQKTVFKTIGIWAMSLLCFLGWIRYVWDLEILPTAHPKSVVAFRITKNSYQLQILQIWFFSLHWIKLKSVTLEDQRAMQQIRLLPGFAKSYINEATYPFSLAISPELVSSFPCSWSLPTEINLAAVRSADPVWFGTRKDNLTWKISDCLRGAEGGWECSLRGRLGHPSKRWKERKGG